MTRLDVVTGMGKKGKEKKCSRKAGIKKKKIGG